MHSGPILSVDGLRNQWQASRFAWGKTDCIMATCNHVWAVTGIDPAAPWRGTYDTEEGAQAIYAARGGVLGLFRYGMALAGFKDAPRGVLRPVVCRVGAHEVAGVDTGKRVMFMAAGRGLVEMPAKVIGAWAI